jgi:tetratricopeptide (TPR) repeat protein
MGNRRQYEQVFGSVVNQQFLYTEPGNLSDYYNFLDGLDIGLAPLLATPYNVCRSDVKFIEYASRGVVPVVSDVGPYKKHARHGVNAFLFADAESLRNVLEMLINDRSLRQEIKEKAYDYVKNKRREDIRAGERISFYEGVAQNRSTGPVPTQLLKRLSEGTQAYEVKQTSAERKVIEGAYLESEGRSEKARALWLEAARELPEYYFPLFCAANSLMKNNEEKAIENFRLAVTINPESLRSRYLLGQALKGKQREAAREEFEEALEIFPDYAPAWKELAVLEKEQGSLEEAGKLMNKALEANPFYASAASELGEIYLAQERKNSAIEAFRVAADLIPDNPDYQRQVIEALVESGRFDEASQECLDYLKRYPRASEFYAVLAKILGSQGKQKEALLAGEMADKYSD